MSSKIYVNLEYFIMLQYLFLKNSRIKMQVFSKVICKTLKINNK